MFVKSNVRAHSGWLEGLDQFCWLFWWLGLDFYFCWLAKNGWVPLICHKLFNFFFWLEFWLLLRFICLATLLKNWWQSKLTTLTIVNVRFVPFFFFVKFSTSLARKKNFLGWKSSLSNQEESVIFRAIFVLIVEIVAFGVCTAMAGSETELSNDDTQKILFVVTLIFPLIVALVLVFCLLCFPFNFRIRPKTQTFFSGSFVCCCYQSFDVWKNKLQSTKK